MSEQIEREIAHLDWRYSPACAAKRCKRDASFFGKHSCCGAEYMLCDQHRQVADQTLAWARVNNQLHTRCGQRITAVTFLEWLPVDHA